MAALKGRASSFFFAADEEEGAKPMG